MDNPLYGVLFCLVVCFAFYSNNHALFQDKTTRVAWHALNDKTEELSLDLVHI